MSLSEYVLFMVNKEQIETLCALGYTQKQIAAEIGIKRGDVNYYMTKYGLSTGRDAPNKKKWDQNEYDMLSQMVANGMTNRSISKVINRVVDSVSKYLKFYRIHRTAYVPHPNLKVDFFQTIDSKEKAYWLGFLYADGYITKGNGATVLDLSDKDFVWLEKFCDVIGVDRSKIVNRIHKQGYRSSSVRIQSRQFTEHLVLCGCTNAKSKNIRLPDLHSMELDMAFLMGYYDGDGTANGTEICSGSIDFLNDIRRKYGLKFMIRFGKHVPSLNLGADFKRSLIMNYPDGMPRKHSTYSKDKQHKLRGTRQKMTERKFHVSKEELEQLISEYTYADIARKFGVADISIKKRARSLGIELINRKRGPRKKVKMV